MLQQAWDFNQAQYNLMLKLFEDIALQSQRQEFRKVVNEITNEYPNTPLKQRGDTWHEIIKVRDKILKQIK